MFKKIFIVLLVVVLATALYINRTWIGENVLATGAAPSPTAAPAAPLTLLPPPAARYKFATIDPTTSSVKSFALNAKNALISAVAAYVPAKPSVQEQKKSGVAPISALHLKVNLVTSLPLQTGQPGWGIDIPAVPGLPVQPDFLAPGATAVGGPLDQWTALQGTWKTAYAKAAAAAAAAAAALQGVDLGIEQNSSIAGAVSAQLQLAPASGNVSFFLASDLQENQGAQTSGSFNGAPLAIEAACPSGIAKECTGAYEAFAAWAKSRHAGAVTRIDPGNISSAIITWIGA